MDIQNPKSRNNPKFQIQIPNPKIQNPKKQKSQTNPRKSKHLKNQKTPPKQSKLVLGVNRQPRQGPKIKKLKINGKNEQPGNRKTNNGLL